MFCTVPLSETDTTKMPSFCNHIPWVEKAAGFECMDRALLSFVCDPVRFVIVIVELGDKSQLICSVAVSVLDAFTRGLFCPIDCTKNSGRIISKGLAPFSTPNLISLRTDTFDEYIGAL